LTAVAVLQLQAAAVRLWFPGSSASASGQQQAMLSAREKAPALRLWFPERSASVLGREQAMPSVKQKAAADLRLVACHLLAAAVDRQLRAAADPLWFPGPSALAPAQEAQMVSAKADRRRAACHLPAASRWAGSDRAPECSEDSYSESESLLGRPMAEARARARQQRRLQQCRHLQYRRWRAMPLMRRQAASGMQGPEVEGRKFGSARLDW
jgi:hypothetical protein